MAWREAQREVWDAQSEYEDQLVNPTTGRYYPSHEWHEALDVQRGQAPSRLQLDHGFVKQIVSWGSVHAGLLAAVPPAELLVRVGQAPEGPRRLW